jgi:pyruvate,orthophosphate dikinase
MVLPRLSHLGETLITYPIKVQSIPGNISVENVGNKAYNLMVMASLELPVPKGFVIPVSVSEFSKDELIKEFNLYGLKPPVSVRSSGAVSMPGMMDTILNVGSNIENTENTEDLAFKLNCYSRLIQSLGTTVYDVDYEKFETIEGAAKDFYIDDDVAMYRKIVDKFNDIWFENIHQEFPSQLDEQLYIAAIAVKDSWNSTRAREYRQAEGISDNGGTAVIVQEMVFGNRNNMSGTGVVFSHNPNTGKPGLYGDFLPFAQGDDIVSGSKIPRSIESMIYDDRFKKVGKQLKAHIAKLLRYYKYIQDVEFTIDNNELFILQTRNGKCSPRASIRSALSMINTGTISITEATDMVLQSWPKADDKRISVDDSNLNRLGFGIGVSEGEAIGFIASSKSYAEELRSESKPYIFCAQITSPEDTEAMRHSVGVITSMGGRLSHAAILARSMSKPTIVGFDSMSITSDGIVVDEDFYKNGDMIKIDGTTGAVFYVIPE